MLHSLTNEKYIETSCTASHVRNNKYAELKSKIFTCDCGRQFKKASQLGYHIRRVHQEEKNNSCVSCDKAFFKRSDLDAHILTHINEFKCICKFCGRPFKHISNMNRHMRTHTKVKPYPCNICSKRFSQVSALQQHLLTEQHKCAEKERNSYIPVPGLGFVDADDPDEGDGDLGSFLRTANKVDQGSDLSNRKWWFYCRICGGRFQFVEQLRMHEEQHSLHNELTCKLCNEAFESVDSLKRHGCGEVPNVAKQPLKSLELENIKKSPDIQSSECPRISTESVPVNSPSNVELKLVENGQILIDNKEVLLILNDKVYGAVLVNSDVTIVENDAVHRVLKGCTNKIEKNSVMSVKEQEKEPSGFPKLSVPVLGNDCELAEKEKLLVVQLWMFDQKLGEKDEPKPSNFSESAEVETPKLKPKFTCTECGKVFNKKHNYQQHLGTHFVNEQRYECPICSRHFAWKSTVGKHMAREHDLREEYTCDQCGKIYNSSIVLQYHIQRDHLKVREHKCSKCDKAFYRKYDLKLHFRKHSDEKPYICGVCGKQFRHPSNNLRHERLHLKNLEVEQPVGVIGESISPFS